MRKDKPSVTARKVALNIMTLGAKSGMNEILPRGSVDATAKLLVASGVVGTKTIRWAQSPKMVSVYESFDWVLPGQFEAFGYRKAILRKAGKRRDQLRGRTGPSPWCRLRYPVLATGFGISKSEVF